MVKTAWPWKKDIDNEKRAPGILVRMKGEIAHKGFRPGSAQKELSSLGLREGSKVLDFGCGSGIYTITAARIVGPKGKVHAVDLHPASLEIVEAKAQSAGLRNIDTIYSDMETGLDASSADFVIFHGVNGKKRVRGLLSEAHRVMKQSGTLLLLDAGKDEGWINDMLMKDGFFTFAGKQGKVLKYRKIVGSFREVS